MQLNVWNDLAEAKRRWTGKTGTRDTTNKNHTESTRTKRHRTQRDNQSRPKHTGRTIRAPAHHPEKENRQGRNQENIRPTSQSLRQEARRNTTTKRNELRSTSAPAQSADRHTSTKGIKIYLCGGRAEAKVRMYLFFSVQRLHGFRQVLQHVQLHVAN